MNSKNLNLWIDASNGRLYDGWNSNNNAEAITFRQGDKVSLELHLVRKSNASGVDFHDEVTFPDNCIVRVAVGLVDSAPTDGTWTATFGADTATIPYNATELQANTLINAMASVTAAGGVTVTKLSNTIFKVDFLSVGVRPAMTLDATGLVPVCTARRIPLKVGSATARDSFTIKVYQTPVAFQSVFVDAPDPVLSVTTLTTNKERRISLSPTPRAGSLAITSTANILPFQDADLANPGPVSYSLATHWARLATTRINVSQTGVSDFYYPDSVETDFYSRGKSKFQSNVTRISDAIWDLTLSESTYYNDRTSSADQRLVNTVPAGYTFPVNVTAAGILKFNSKIGVLSFDTAEVEYLLSGQQSVGAILEIELQDIDNNRWTVLQTPCTVTNDLIDQTAFNPISYDNAALADAPSDGSQYARKNGSWQVVTAPDVAANWGNIGGTLSSQTDLQTELDNKYPRYGNPEGYQTYIDVANTFYPLHTNPNSYATETFVTTRGYITSTALSGYALLSGATFTGKVNTTATASTAPLNIAVATTNPTTTVAGDIWVGMNNIFFKDSINVQRALLNSNTQNTFSAPNTFTGNVVIEGLNNTLPMLRVTQTGAGHSFVVEDNTNPDTSAFIVNNTGQVGINKDPSTFGFVLGVGLDVTGKVLTSSTASFAGLNLGSGTAPTIPVQGDMWLAANTDTLRYRSPLSNLTLDVATRNTSNTFIQPQIVATTATATLPAIRITNLATGSTAHSLVVEDAANPDTTSFIVNNAGNVGVGVNPSAWFPTEKLDINGYATSATAPFADESTKLATTANVKASIRGSVVSVGSSGWTLGYGSGYPNQIVRVYDDAPLGEMIVPTESPEYIPVGTQYVFIQTGTYSFTITTDGGGVQLRSFGNKFQSAGQHAVCTLIKTAVGEWYLAGNLA